MGIHIHNHRRRASKVLDMHVYRESKYIRRSKTPTKKKPEKKTHVRTSQAPQNKVLGGPPQPHQADQKDLSPSRDILAIIVF